MKIAQENTQEIIMSAVNALVELVKPTYGPAENKVIIGRGYSAQALDDGVQIAKDLELEDEAENYVLKLIREVAVKTNDRVGDGTTSSLIMLQAILKEAQQSKKSSRAIITELKKGLTEATKQLKSKSRAIKSEKDLREVAMVSFNNKEIANLLANMIHRVGENGLIDVQSSQGASIESEIVGGFKIQSGTSPHILLGNDKCSIKDALVLTTDKSFLNNNDIIPLLEKLLQAGKNNLVVFCKDFGGEAFATAVINRRAGKFNLIPIKANEQDIKDIALLTGANHILLENKIEVSDLGFAENIVATAEDTKIVGGIGDKDKIDLEVVELNKDPNNARRVANLTGSVAVIKVGAKTESEAKALQFKVEDAANAVRVAHKGGVVAGAGTTLASLKTSSNILNSALKYPAQQLKKNIGNFKIGKKIVDPTEVLIAGIESAVSIACLLISTKGIIYDLKPKQ